MFIAKSLLALPLGTAFNGFPTPLSGVASPFPATVPANTASGGPQYGRMARIAGTAIAAGSVGYGAIKLASFAPHPRPRYLHDALFERNDMTSNHTAVINEILPTLVGPTFSFAAAYEASLLTSLAIINVNDRPFCSARADDNLCMAGSGMGLIRDLLVTQSSAVPATDTTNDGLNVNDPSVLLSSSPNSTVRGSSTFHPPPAPANFHGYANKIPFSFIRLRRVIIALTFLIRICLGAESLPFIASNQTEEEIPIPPSEPWLFLDLSIDTSLYADSLPHVIHRLSGVPWIFWLEGRHCYNQKCLARNGSGAGVASDLLDDTVDYLDVKPMDPSSTSTDSEDDSEEDVKDKKRTTKISRLYVLFGVIIVLATLFNQRYPILPEIDAAPADEQATHSMNDETTFLNEDDVSAVKEDHIDTSSQVFEETQQEIPEDILVEVEEVHEPVRSSALHEIMEDLSEVFGPVGTVDAVQIEDSPSTLVDVETEAADAGTVPSVGEDLESGYPGVEEPQASDVQAATALPSLTVQVSVQVEDSRQRESTWIPAQEGDTVCTCIRVTRNEGQVSQNLFLNEVPSVSQASVPSLAVEDFTLKEARPKASERMDRNVSLPSSKIATALNPNASAFVPRVTPATRPAQPIEVFVGETAYRPPLRERRGRRGRGF